jgi:hypothetical protein
LTGNENDRLATNWRGGRVVDGTGLENRQSASSRGFKSHPLRQLNFDFGFRIESPASRDCAALRADLPEQNNRYDKRGGRAADDIHSRKRDECRKSCSLRSATSATTGIPQSAVMFQCDGGGLF